MFLGALEAPIIQSEHSWEMNRTNVERKCLITICVSRKVNVLNPHLCRHLHESHSHVLIPLPFCHTVIPHTATIDMLKFWIRSKAYRISITCIRIRHDISLIFSFYRLLSNVRILLISLIELCMRRWLDFLTHVFVFVRWQCALSSR